MAPTAMELTVELTGSKPFDPKVLAEREGFSIDPFRQVVVIPTVSDSSLCLCGCRAHS